MMYQTLAHFYDALVKDDEATKDWVDFIKRHMYGTSIMELACGSGEITIALAKAGYEISASDLSEEMIFMAKQKANSERIHWCVQDMNSLTISKKVDTVLCLCDSFNYIVEDTNIQTMFQTIYDGLHDQGVYIMDMHSLDRLLEFQEEFFEDGQIDGKGYQWTINSDEDRIYQNFAFYDEHGNCTLEQHIQRVYDPLLIEEWLIRCGFVVEIYTDFTISGIAPGEKYFYVCKKGLTV